MFLGESAWTSFSFQASQRLHATKTFLQIYFAKFCVDQNNESRKWQNKILMEIVAKPLKEMDGNILLENGGA